MLSDSLIKKSGELVLKLDMCSKSLKLIGILRRRLKQNSHAVSVSRRSFCLTSFILGLSKYQNKDQHEYLSLKMSPKPLWLDLNIFLKGLKALK